MAAVLGCLRTALAARDWQGSAAEVVSEIGQRLKCLRVSIGWVVAGQLRIVALSDGVVLAEGQAIPELNQAMLEAEGLHYLFAPGVADMYPQPMETVVDVPKLGAELEGSVRPGHFAGVATVVTKLFNIAGPDRAYFGEKDFQQLTIIRRMVADLAQPVEVIGVPTVREADGLAMSSRNVHLSPEERDAATVLRRALVAAREAWAAGERSGDALRSVMRDVLATEPLANVEYVSVADDMTLQELSTVDRPALASLAVRFGETRLIDNEMLDADADPDPGTEVRPQVYGG